MTFETHVLALHTWEVSVPPLEQSLPQHEYESVMGKNSVCWETYVCTEPRRTRGPGPFGFVGSTWLMDWVSSGNSFCVTPELL